MDFRPQAGKAKSLDILEIMDDLARGQRFKLLHFLRTCESEDMEIGALLDSLLSSKVGISWLFHSREIERLLKKQFEKSPQGKTLRKHFSYAHKLESLAAGECLYIHNQKILWQIFFKDLESFGIEKDFHLYENLRFHLSISHYGDEGRSRAQLSRILYPFFKSLKDDQRIPVGFLAQTLKIVLYLNPFHPQAFLESLEVLKNMGQFDEVAHLFQCSFENGMREKQFLIESMRFLATHEEYGELSDLVLKIFQEQPPHLDFDFYFEAAETMVEFGRSPALALFLCLKGVSFKRMKERGERMLSHCLILLGDLDLALKIQERLDEPEIFILPPGLEKNTQEDQYQFKTSSLNEFKPFPALLALEQGNHLRIHVKRSESSKESILYPSGSGIFELKESCDEFDLVAVHPRPNPSPKVYTFGGFQWEGSLQGLEALTPFHFQKI